MTLTVPKYRWVILIIGVFAQMTFSVGYAGVAVSGVVIREDYQFSLAQVGVVLGCMGLGVAISEIIWGMLTDKLGDKTVLMAGLILSGITFFITAVVCIPNNGLFSDYRILGALLIVAGAVGGSVNSSSGRAVMSWFKDDERGFAMSIRQTAIPVGAAIGSVIFPIIAMKYGFRIAFLILSLLCFATSICVGVWLKTLKNDVFQNSNRKDTEEFKSPFKRLSVWKIALSGGVLTFPQMAVLTFGSVYLSDVHHISIFLISILLAGIQLGGGVLRIITGWLSDKYKNRCQIICFIALIAGIAGIALGVMAYQNVYIITLLIILTGLSGNAWHGIAYTEIAVVAGSKFSGRALGMIGTTVFAASFATPYVIPYILSNLSWSGVWITVGIGSLVALPLMFEFIKKPKEA
jgi:sugar phosphate permease